MPDAGRPGAVSPEAPPRTPIAGTGPRLAWAAIELAPVGLVVIAEAAWISVVAGLVQEFNLRGPEMGIPILAVFVLAGIAAARLLGRRLGRRWPATALGLIVVASLLGCLAAAGSRAALADGLGPAIAAHPGGLLAGLALLRGMAHARLPLAESTVAHLLGVGVPGLAIAAIVGGVIVDPFRARFLADALDAAVVFVVASILALALVRLTSIGRDAGFDWRRNPVWLGLMILMLAVAILAAVPLSTVAGTAIETLIAIAIGPLLVAGLVIGFNRTARRIVTIILVGGGAVYLLVVLFGGNGREPEPPPAALPGEVEPSVVDQLLTVSVGGILLLVAVALILALAAVWMRRTQPPDADLVRETRSIDRGSDGPSRPRRRLRLPGRGSAPTTAVEAYLALDRDLARHPTVRREPAETPAEHAARMRLAGHDELALDLLAADYAIARFGGERLTPGEDRRGVARWQRLRTVLARADRAGRPPLVRSAIRELTEDA